MICSLRAITWSALLGSRAAVCSSSRSNCGLSQVAMSRVNAWRWPPDRLPMALSRRSSRPSHGLSKAIAKQIVQQGGDYVLTVKENQGHLLEDIQATVEKALDGLLPGDDVDGYCKVESGHGRDEERSYVVIHNVEQIEDLDQWANLTTVGMCRSVRTVRGESSEEV